MTKKEIYALLSEVESLANEVESQKKKKRAKSIRES
jgi:hypothetical protein